MGTHALFQEEFEFSDLALVIIDEQHRFGVHQRLMLREKGEKRDFIPSVNYDGHTDSRERWQ